MAKPVLPILPGENLPAITIAKDQPGYLPLPAFRNPNGEVLTRWKLTLLERLLVLLRGDIYLWVATFNKPLQPILIEIERPKVVKESEPE